MVVATIVGFRMANLSVAWTSVGIILTCVVMCLTVSSLYRLFRPDPSIACGTECAAQLMLVLSLGCVLSYPLAKVGFPYRDAGLNAADIWMGLDWRAYLHFFNDRPLLGALARLTYDSVFVQFLILIASLAAPSRLLRLQQYIFATALALVVTLAVFTFVPAGGIYTFHAISPDEFANLSPVMSTDQIIYLDAIRSGEHTLVSSLGGPRYLPELSRYMGDFVYMGILSNQAAAIWCDPPEPVHARHHADPGRTLFHRPRRRCSRRGGRNLCRREIYARS